MAKKIIVCILIIILGIFNCKILFSDVRELVIIGGSSAYEYVSDDKHILDKASWANFIDSYIDSDIKIVNYSKRGSMFSDLINNNEIKEKIDKINMNDILIIQIEESDYENKDLIDDLNYLDNISSKKNSEIFLILPFHKQNNYAGKTKNILYDDNDILHLKVKNKIKVVDPNFPQVEGVDKERFKFVLSAYKDKSKGYDYEAYNYVFANYFAKAIANCIDGEEFTYKNSAYKITRGMYVSQLLKFANQVIKKGETFSDVANDYEFANDIATAKEMGIICGTSDKFYPNDEITLGDASLIAANLLRNKGYALPEYIRESCSLGENSYQTQINIYADIMGVKPYAVESVFAMLYNDVYFNPMFDVNEKIFTILDIYRLIYEKVDM